MQEVFEKIKRRISIVATEAYGYTPITRVISEREIKEIIESEEEEYNNGWVPCSEPPEIGVYVLLSFSNFSVPTVGRYEEDEKGGAYYIGDEDETCTQQGIFVNAWQQLPAPYNPHICTNNDCVFDKRKDCPAAEGCAGHERKITNFDRCCESIAAMAQIIDIAKIGWTKDQIMEWLQKEVCAVPE